MKGEASPSKPIIKKTFVEIVGICNDKELEAKDGLKEEVVPLKSLSNPKMVGGIWWWWWWMRMTIAKEWKSLS